ncbi:MAG: hypothetical protein JNL71_16090 [Rhodospirillales bacterium]|nr:hypothetical protein [Rhodospirillales bacterium]
MQRLRDAGDGLMRTLSDGAVPGGRAAVAGRVLVDGTWDNANYWFRFAMVRRALGLSGVTMTGLVGAFRRGEVAATFERFGVDARIDLQALSRIEPRHRTAARTLLARVRTAEDILRAELPGGMPGEIFYDGVLKRQRRGTADLADPLLPDHVAEQFASIDAAVRVLDEVRPDLLLLTHGLNFSYGSLAWEGIRRGIPVLLLYGDFGTTRFVRLFSRGDLFVFPSRPSRAELAGLAPATRVALERVGAEQLELRRRGRTNDIGGRYAYRAGGSALSKAEICRRYGWDPAKPIVGVYASNPFDYPHCTGMYHFRDFVEWNRETVAAAARNPHANFLCKPHPIDRRYGLKYGEGLADAVMAVASAHVRLADEAWSGAELMRCLDGAVTHHGSVGFEAAAMGIPVMTTDCAWYDEVGFVARPASKAAYLDKLASEWWRDWPTQEAISLANLAAGLYYGVPDWQGGYIFRDDSDQDAIYETLPAFIADHGVAIEREIATIRDWYDAAHPFFHMFKMFRSSGFGIGNATD